MLRYGELKPGDLQTLGPKVEQGICTATTNHLTNIDENIIKLFLDGCTVERIGRELFKGKQTIEEKVFESGANGTGFFRQETKVNPRYTSFVRYCNRVIKKYCKEK